ncbi:RNA-binding protein [Candidatus Woesearchaeota archaeon]|nr:RNA-binding protein [Candidatus Woesearchaeota archaeon]
MKRLRLRKKELKELQTLLTTRYGLQDFFDKYDKNVVIELIGDTYLFIDGNVAFFWLQGELIPSLKLVLQSNFLKTVTIDMGAVKFVANGADIMRPGITTADAAIVKDDMVTIIDQNHGRPLAIGKALYAWQEFQNITEGKIIRNLHFVGDKHWNFSTKK